MSELKLSHIDNKMQCKSCDVPLVLEENTNEKCMVVALNVIKKMYEIIDY